MSKREILVVDSDSTVCEQLADRFRSAGYDVETTDSTAHLFDSVLEKQIPVVLLGSGCCKKIAMAKLIPMLKKCNKGVTIILVSDEESLPTIRSVRQEGIFYHALKPAGRDDTEEILTAVNCAFNESERNERMQVTLPAAKLEPSPVATIPSAAARIMEPAAVPPETVQANPARVSWQGEKKKIRTKAAVILTALTVAVAGIAYCVMASINGMKVSDDFMIAAFLGFCALMVIGQLLPAFIAVRAAKKVVAQRLQDSFAGDGEKQPVADVSDKYK